MDTHIAQLQEYAYDAKRHLSRIDARQEQAATKADLDRLKSDIGIELFRTGTDLIIWMAAIAAAVSFVVISIMTLVIKNAAPAACTGAPAPIVIYPQSAPPTQVAPVQSPPPAQKPSS